VALPNRAILATGLFRFTPCKEGFGLPLLEAMASRTPVLCCNAGSLPEVAGDGALLFDPLDVGDMARAIKQVLQEPSLRARLVGCGLKRVDLFSFRRAAEATLELYNELLHSKCGLDSSEDVRCSK
jgi:alpha-1,3-rhamnosyl/mannosyltransferase